MSAVERSNVSVRLLAVRRVPAGEAGQTHSSSTHAADGATDDEDIDVWRDSGEQRADLEHQYGGKQDPFRDIDPEELTLEETIRDGSGLLEVKPEEAAPTKGRTKAPCVKMKEAETQP